MAAAIDVISTMQVANVGETVVSEEVKQMRSNAKRARLLEKHDETDEDMNVRLLPDGLFIRSSVVGIPPGLSVLQQTRHVFIRQGGEDFINAYSNIPNRFELVDTDGYRLLFAGETYEDFDGGNGCLGAGSVTFDVCVLGVRGGGVLNIRANKTGLVKITDFHSVVGTVKDTTGFGCYASHRTYSVRDSENFEVFKIRMAKQKVLKEREFEIFDRDMVKIGYIRKMWNADTDKPEHVPIDGILCGLCFPQDMDTNEKILLMGALFTVYFQHHHDGGHGSVKHGCCHLTVFIAIVLLILGLIVGLILWLVLGDKFKKMGDHNHNSTTVSP